MHDVDRRVVLPGEVRALQVAAAAAASGTAHPDLPGAARVAAGEAASELLALLAAA